jgi:hypothetical protein
MVSKVTSCPFLDSSDAKERFASGAVQVIPSTPSELATRLKERIGNLSIGDRQIRHASRIDFSWAPLRDCGGGRAPPLEPAIY